MQSLRRSTVGFVLIAAAFGSGHLRQTAAAQRAAAPPSGRSINWALHNLDLAGSRYSAMDQITRSNVATLSPRWLFNASSTVSATRPAGRRGRRDVRHRPARRDVLDAADGHLLWSYDVTDL
jgi:glucose dehydrogenase